MNPSNPHDTLIEAMLDGTMSRQEIAARLVDGSLPRESVIELERFLKMAGVLQGAVNAARPSAAAVERWRRQLDRLVANGKAQPSGTPGPERADASPLHLTEADGVIDDASLPFPTPAEEDQYDVRAAGRDDESPPAESGKGAGHDPD